MGANRQKLRKRSGANSNSKPPKPLVFFIDRSLGQKIIATALRHAGVEVRIHDDYFPKDAKDEEWLREVGQKGWIVFTKDQKIGRRPSELRALMDAQVAAFVLTASTLQAREMAAIFVKALPAISRFVKKNTPPFIAKVTASGSVSMLISGR